MKIAVCAQSNNNEANVDSRFGRAAFFAVFDDSTNQWDFIENRQNMQAAQGAGIQAAQTIIDAEIDVLLACNVGPKAMSALSANGIAVFLADAQQTLQEALDAYRGDKLPQIDQANVEGHWA